MNQVEGVNIFNGALDIFANRYARLTASRDQQAEINITMLKTILEPEVASTDGTLQTLASLISKEKAASVHDRHEMETTTLTDILKTPEPFEQDRQRILKNKSHFQTLLTNSKLQCSVTIDGLELSDFDVDLSDNDLSKLTGDDDSTMDGTKCDASNKCPEPMTVEESLVAGDRVLTRDDHRSESTSCSIAPHEILPLVPPPNSQPDDPKSAALVLPSPSLENKEPSVHSEVTPGPALPSQDSD